MLGEALALYRKLIEAGHAELDTSAVFKLYEQRLILPNNEHTKADTPKETHMKRRILLSALAAAVLATCAFATSAQAQIKLRYAHVGVANARRPCTPDEVAKLVKERTNGRVEIQVFANSQLGGVGEMVDGIKSRRHRPGPP